MQNKKETSGQRPLSPHLQIYKPQLTSVMSIMHRISGIALFAGLLLLSSIIITAAYSPVCYECLTTMAGKWYSQVILMCFTLAMYYHLCNGVRHLFWDMGKGLTIPAAYRSGQMVLLVTTILTAATWFLIKAGQGGI